jgi:hypothetical protein
LKGNRQQDQADTESRRQMREQQALASGVKQMRQNAMKDKGLTFNLSPEEERAISKLEDMSANPTRYQQVLNDPKIRKAMQEYSYALNLKNAQGKSKQFTSRLDARSNPFVTI